VSEERFPIMRGWLHMSEECLSSIPWSLIAPHEQQAQLNHGGQTLKRLAERGGLDALEAVAVLEDVDYRKRWPEQHLDRQTAQELTSKAFKRLAQLCGES